MDFKSGAFKIDDIKLGIEQVDRVYLGNILIWQHATAPRFSQNGFRVTYDVTDNRRGSTVRPAGYLISGTLPITWSISKLSTTGSNLTYSFHRNTGSVTFDTLIAGVGGSEIDITVTATNSAGSASFRILARAESN